MIDHRTLAGLAGGLALLAACGKPPEEPPPAVAFEPLPFAELEGWGEDDPEAALAAFGRSCRVIARRDPAAAFHATAPAGEAGHWQAICRDAELVPAGPAAARQFFEQHFQPYRVTAEGSPDGLFTGYFEPLLFGSAQPNGIAAVPLHGTPDDLVAVDLGAFAEDLRGRQIRGRVAGNRLEPYPSRGEIERGALSGRGLELVWVDDPIAKFFLQIQGSGLVELDDGRTLRVGYAEQNGRAYRAIGRDLVEIGALTPEEVSLQSIREWLRANPDEAQAMMDRNPSYIFFHVLGEADEVEGPLGAQNVALEPGRSLAVDRAFVPLGAPVWLDTTAPFPDGDRPLRRLMIAQDTGGAIKGAVRGDVFWGAGDLAEHVAGHMKSLGRYFILLPKAATPTS